MSSSSRRNPQYDGLSAVEWEERYFKDRFFELVEYKADHGHVDVPRDGSILGLWASAQRSQYKNKELPSRRVKVLAALGFNFHPTEDVMALEQRYFQSQIYDMVVYRAYHGHCRVPKDGSRLSRWMGSLRTQFKRGEVSEDRIKILDSLDFEWKRTQSRIINKSDNLDTTRNDDTITLQVAGTSPPRRAPRDLGGPRAAAYAKKIEQKWEEKFQQLVQYKEKHGNVMVPQDNRSLGRWVSTQRERRRQNDLNDLGTVQPPDKKRPAPLSAEQIAKLDSLGFKWKVNTVVSWETRYQQLVEYRRQHGDVHVSQSYSEDISLGRWVMKQRVQYNYRKAGEKSSMTDDRIVKLEKIGFAWIAPGFRQKGERLLRKRKRTDEEFSGGVEGMTEDDLVEDTGRQALSDDDGAAAVLVTNAARTPYYLNQRSPHSYHHHFYP